MQPSEKGGGDAPVMPDQTLANLFRFGDPLVLFLLLLPPLYLKHTQTSEIDRD